MLTEATKRAGAEAEGLARRVLLDLYELTMAQPERWVLVDTLRRRLAPLSAQDVDVGVACSGLSRWIELDGPVRMRRVRLTDLGRVALGLRIVQRPWPPEPQAKPAVVTPSAMVRR
jgi:hypothetical protein